MRILHSAFRVVLIAGCAFAFACALLIVWATCVAGSMPEEWWVSWTRLMLMGKALVVTGVFGEARVKVWQRELSNRAATPVGSVTPAMPWKLDVVSR